MKNENSEFPNLQISNIEIRCVKRKIILKIFVSIFLLNEIDINVFFKELVYKDNNIKTWAKLQLHQIFCLIIYMKVIIVLNETECYLVIAFTCLHGKKYIRLKRQT